MGARTDEGPNGGDDGVAVDMDDDDDCDDDDDDEMDDGGNGVISADALFTTLLGSVFGDGATTPPVVVADGEGLLPCADAARVLLCIAADTFGRWLGNGGGIRDGDPCTTGAGFGFLPIRVRCSSNDNQRGKSAADGAVEPFLGFLPGGKGRPAGMSLRKMTSRNA